MATVKSTSRADKARQTRRRVLEAARNRFIEHGYAAATMEQIASDAGVAVQTVYYTFGTKGRLLTEVVDVTAAGTDERVPPMQRAWAQEMLSTRSAQRALALAVEHGTAIYDRVADLWPAVNAAAALDADVATYWRGVDTGRRNGQAALVARLRELDSLRQDLSDSRAADVLVFLAGHAPYSGLVVDAGWSSKEYRVWLFETLKRQLLASQRREAQSIADLSFSSPDTDEQAPPIHQEEGVMRAVRPRHGELAHARTYAPTRGASSARSGWRCLSVTLSNEAMTTVENEVTTANSSIDPPGRQRVRRGEDLDPRY